MYNLYIKKANLIYYEKNYFQRNRYILEAKIWSVDDARYTDGIKYSLAFIDTKSDRKVLFDNHHPKGAHFQLDKVEFPYCFQNDSQLIRDLKKLIFQHFGVTV